MMRSRTAMWLLLGALGPLVLMSFYLVITRGLTHHSNGLSDWVAVAVSCLPGALGVAKSSPPGWPKTIVIVIYLPLMAAFLFFYSFLFLCTAFKDCL